MGKGTHRWHYLFIALYAPVLAVMVYGMGLRTQNPLGTAGLNKSQQIRLGGRSDVDQLAALRRGDAIRGAKIIGAQFKVLNQRNQNMRVDPDVYDEFNKTLVAEKPDVVFGMWPLEFHPDHRAAAMLAYNAWLASGMKFAFYFSECQEAGEMTTQQFAPNRWVDIEPVIDLKREAVVANTFINLHGRNDFIVTWLQRSVDFGYGPAQNQLEYYRSKSQ